MRGTARSGPSRPKRECGDGLEGPDRAHGWRMHGRDSRPKRVFVGYRYIHTAVDDRTRVAYSEILDDEKGSTAAEFWDRAHAWFTSRGINIERALTDNGACYRSRIWSDALNQTGVAHKRTRPYRPQTNGKVSNASTGSCSKNGPTSATGPQKGSDEPPMTGSSTSTINTHPTAHSAGPLQWPPSTGCSRTTSPRTTTRTATRLRSRLSPPGRDITRKTYRQRSTWASRGAFRVRPHV